MKSLRLNIPLLILTLGVIGLLLAAAIHLTEIDTDITRFLPHKQTVFSDAGRIFKYHPLQSAMVIDLGVSKPDRQRLLQCGQFATKRLKASGLFDQVGTESMQSVVPDLMNHVMDHLPVLFTADELTHQVLPLLDPSSIRHQLAALRNQLMGLDAIGQAEWIARDPLGFRRVVLAKLAQLAPTTEVQIYQGQLFSKDNRHLLLVAAPARPGTDTAFARRIADLMDTLGAELRQRYGADNPVTLTPMGAYRAALDNERIMRRDVQKAIVLATLGIAVLLLLAFPRPVVGLFAFLPAVAGTVAAFFVLALAYRTLSIMALGFGGAIISITVDHGIAYLLFLDRSTTSYGKAASTEVRAIGLMATLTSVGAFSALYLTGFPVLQQLGLFAGLGIAFSFLFVHLVFPKLFPALPPAKKRSLPLRKLVDKLPVARKGAALVALGFAVIMGLQIRPDFNTRLSAMNTVGPDTAAAEDLVTQVWGSAIFNKIYLMAEAPSPEALQKVDDTLQALADEDLKSHRLKAGFMPSTVFPGPERRRENWAAWRAFWTQRRVAAVRQALARAADLGFAGNAFAPFMKMIRAQNMAAAGEIPKKYHALMGIAKRADGTWMQFATFAPGQDYDADLFRERYGGTARIFDPTDFSHAMGRALFATFTRMLTVIGIGVALMLIFFFLDLKLTLIALTPVLFALVCTLGTLGWTGRQLDIPALMLAIIVFGMGIDYALFLVCAYQRYGGTDHPGFGRIKLAVIMASVSTLIGFGVLCTAEHSLLRSAGLTSFLGIAYSLLGAFILLPPLLDRYFRPSHDQSDPSSGWRKRVMARYRSMATYARLFARFKLQYDVMFAELPQFLNGASRMRTVLDIGCGFGVPGCWMLDRYTDARIYGIDPDGERILVATRAFGRRGHADCDLAPNIPLAPDPADAALLLDIIHFLDDDDLRLTLRRLHKAMHPDGLLILRAVIPPKNHNYSWHWRFDAARRKLAGISAYFRSSDDIVAILASAGFQTEQRTLSGGNEESVWLIAKADPSCSQARHGTSLE